jgi:NADH-quinone oxidoreductase subunit E
MGAESLISYLEKKLGLKSGQTTADGRFSLMRVECLGACDGSPMMLMNDRYYLNLTPEKLDDILDNLPE